jgi:hypothetical protein
MLESLESLLFSFTQHLVFSGIIFLTFFVLFGFVFSGGAFIPFLQGMVRVAVSMVYSPFVFLRRSSNAILGFGRRGEQDYVATEHYLLNKLLLWWQAVVIVVAMGWLAVTVVQTWYAFLPPEEVRTALRTTREKLAEEQEQLVTATADATRFETDWNQQKPQLISAYRMQRERTSRSATDQNTRLDREVRASGNQMAIADLGILEAYANQHQQSVEQIAGAHRDLDRWINNQMYLDEPTRSKLHAWGDNWERGAQAADELRNLSETALRNGAQPGYQNTLARKADLEQRVPITQQLVKDLEEQAHFRWTEALFTVVKSLLQFLFAVWVFGLLTEALSLMIRVADHVRALRQRLAPDTGTHEHLPQPAERLPIAATAAQAPAMPL